MKQLLPTNDYGIYADKQEQILIESRFVAEKLGKQHAHVMRDIRENILPFVSEEFRLSNFGESSYKNTQNKKQPMYVMTQEGFNFLVFSYNDKTLYPYKEEYIKRFNEMEQYLRTYISARDEFSELTSHIQMLYGDSKLSFRCIHEQNMLYTLSTGLTAVKIRERHGLSSGTVVRPYLSADELELFEVLQRIDIGLLVSVPDRKDRETILTTYKNSYMLRYQLIQNSEVAVS